MFVVPAAYEGHVRLYGSTIEQEAMVMVCAFARNRVAVHGPCFPPTMKCKETTFAILISAPMKGLCDTPPTHKKEVTA